MTEQIRREYEQGQLRRLDLAGNPLTLFTRWLADAEEAGVVDATAMTLASVNADGQPSARIVLLKQHDEHGFVWYTDSESQKGVELAGNPRAALLFYWRELERQVRITGTVSRVAPDIAERYFASRPQLSQISAAASHQSAPIKDRATLEAAAAAIKQQVDESGELNMPQRWGGYRLMPSEFEFWQGRTGRLHDRFRYRKDASEWLVERLQP